MSASVTLPSAALARLAMAGSRGPNTAADSAVRIGADAPDFLVARAQCAERDVDHAAVAQPVPRDAVARPGAVERHRRKRVVTLFLSAAWQMHAHRQALAMQAQSVQGDLPGA
ncbi:hypothetical protein LP420_27820 [Massilia sp. B-10]|nr:hypothetical protein LP420_27820 [Massilia sp. B-10]